MDAQFLPLFPLNVVAFPGEQLNLHIFEPRYKQLIAEIAEKNGTFGIPLFVNGRVAEYGTEMQLTTIEKVHPNGEIDIKTKGLRVFKMLNFFAKTPNKLYPSGMVEFIDDVDNHCEEIQLTIILELQKMYHALNIRKEFSNFNAFSIAHHVGLNMEQEYQILCMCNEKDRQAFILQHLQKIVPIVIEAEKLKEKVRLNGYFRNFEELKF